MVIGAAAIAVAIVAVAVLVAVRTAADFLSDRADTRLRDVARRGELVTEQALLERARQVELIGASPTVVEAARLGAQRAAQLGLVGRPIEVLERQMAETRSLGVSENARRYLQSQLAPLGVAEMFVTDVNGFTAVSTEMTSDFVQNDEAWWRDAVRKGLTSAEAEFDESARQTVVSMAAAIREPGREKPEGVLKIAFGIPTLDAALGRATSSETRLDVLDGRGRLIASSSRNGARMKPLAGADQIPGAAGDTIVEFTTGDTTRRGMVAAANDGSWRVVASMDEASVLEPLRDARPMIAATLIAVLSFLVLTLWSMSRFLDRRLSVPVTELAGVAEAVASGDLSTAVIPSGANDEIGRLSRATSEEGFRARARANIRSASAKR